MLLLQRLPQLLLQLPLLLLQLPLQHLHLLLLPLLLLLRLLLLLLRLLLLRLQLRLPLDRQPLGQQAPWQAKAPSRGLAAGAGGRAAVGEERGQAWAREAERRA